MIEPRYNYKGVEVPVDQVVKWMKKLLKELPDSDDEDDLVFIRAYNTALCDVMHKLDLYVSDVRYPVEKKKPGRKKKIIVRPRFKKPSFVANYYMNRTKN